MFEKMDTKITRYKHGDYFVDVIQLRKNLFAGWISHKDVDISVRMFSLHCDDEESFLRNVSYNIEHEEKDYYLNFIRTDFWANLYEANFVLDIDEDEQED